MKYDTRYNFNGKGVSKVTKILFTKKELQEMELLSQGKTIPIKKVTTNRKGYTYEYTVNKKFSFENAHKRLLALYGGHCISCGKWPNLVLSHNKGDEVQPATKIERYCNSCYSNLETDTHNKQRKKESKK